MVRQKPLKILQASAGSGKTFSLAVHYLTLLFSHDTKYRDILAVTFTNKATEEMKTRILEVLKGFATGEAQFDGYRAMVLAAHPNLDKEALNAKADIIYRKILHDYSRFSVYTIDGFVQKVIRGFAFELGLGTGYDIEMNYVKVKNNLIEMLNQDLVNQPKLLQWVVDLSLEKIDNEKNWNYNKELLRLADEIFKEGYQPFENALLTLSQDRDLDTLFAKYKAETDLCISNFEREMIKQAQIASEIFDVSGVSVAHLNGKSRSPLCKWVSIIGGNFSLIHRLAEKVDNPDSWFQKGVSSHLYEELNPVIRKMVDLYQRDVAVYHTAKIFKKNIYYLRLMQEMAMLLKKYREQNDNLLISDAQKLLQGITDDADDNPSFIWEKMGSRYKNFLFDEFQDTSYSQWSSFKALLSNRIATHDGKLIDHLIVGDTKQSIYRWRSGDANILHQQAKLDIGTHYVEDDSLEMNFRSSEEIINFNNRLYKTAPTLLQEVLNKEINDLNLPEIATWWAGDYHQFLPSVYSRVEQKLAPKTPKGGVIKVNVLSKTGEGSDGEDDFITSSIQNTLAEIGHLIGRQGYLPQDICVLVRNNSEAVLMVNVLLAANISVLSGEALLLKNNMAIKLLINTLQLFISTVDNASLYKANCMVLYAGVHNKTLHPECYLDLKYKTVEQLNGLLPNDLCLNWRNWLQLPLPELMEKLIRAYGLDKLTQHLPYLLALRDIVGDFFRQGEKGIHYFLNYWHDECDHKALPSSEGDCSVQVMTIHKSKGLAFRAVLLPFCTWKLDGKGMVWFNTEHTAYAHLQSIPVEYVKDLKDSSFVKPYFKEKIDSYMDALNVLYVATTRAIDYLYINLVDKKSDTLTSISDLVKHALLPEGNKEYVIDQPISTAVAPPALVPVNLTEYPTSNRLATLFDSNLRNRDIDLLNTENAGRIGTLLHEIMALAATKEDIDAVLTQMQDDGDIKAEERNDLKTRALEVFNHPDLQNLLAQSTQTITEQTIVDANGISYRPDKVLITERGAIIIDYKFTQEQQDKHIEQIDHYKLLLNMMGYTQIETYLFYANSGYLKRV